jgi:hypothetical protein
VFSRETKMSSSRRDETKRKETTAMNVKRRESE